MCCSLAQVIIISYSVAIYISYGLQGYVPVQIMWTNYIAKRVEDVNEKKKAFYEYLLRIICVIVTCKFFPILCKTLMSVFNSCLGNDRTFTGLVHLVGGFLLSVRIGNCLSRYNRDVRQLARKFQSENVAVLEGHFADLYRCYWSVGR